MREEEKFDLKEIVSNFQIQGEFIEAIPYGTGHINDTYVSNIQTGSEVIRYIHQHINDKIFKNVENLMENIERVTSHVKEKVIEAGGDPERNSLNLIPSNENNSFHIDQDGNYWRTYMFIKGARTYDIIENPVHVFNASAAFGEFQKMLADLPGKRLHETIPGFHNTKKGSAHLQRHWKKDPLNRAAEAKPEVAFVLEREKDTALLVDLLDKGEVVERATHNDTKFNNVMIDDETDKGICVIDLDTVMPGLVMYDFGDSVRIGASTGAEDERDLSKINMDISLFEQLAHGYLDTAREFLTKTELDHLAFSAKLMTFECGMRFLGDFIDGDNYFKVHREKHNLDRCRTQFKMVEDMEAQMVKMEFIVKRYSD